MSEFSIKHKTGAIHPDKDPGEDGRFFTLGFCNHLVRQRLVGIRAGSLSLQLGQPQHGAARARRTGIIGFAALCGWNIPVFVINST